MMRNKIVDYDFFRRDALLVAPDLLGKYLVAADSSGLRRFRITETEAYRGVEDLACHASKGRTKRTEVMFMAGGLVYVYLIYGMYHMLNIVTGVQDEPQAVLIRGVDAAEGPGRVSRLLGIDKSFYGEDLTVSSRLWLEDGQAPAPESLVITPRIGIDYAGEWKDKLWRFVVKS
jgi:DNA-3-methyladenine glycosylase